MRKHNFSRDQQTEICRLYDEDVSMKEIAAMYRVSPKVSARVLDSNNVARRSVSEAKGGLGKHRESEVCRRYLALESAPALADNFNVSSSTIYNILDRHGIPRRSNAEANGGLSHAKVSEVCARFLNGERQLRLAREFGVSPTTIARVLDRMGIERRARALNESQELEVCRRYNAKERVSEISREYTITSTTVYNILKRHDVPRRPYSVAQGGLDLEAELELCRRYEEGEDSPTLGQEYGVYPSTVFNILRRHGIPLRSLSEAKGGLSKDQQNEVCRRYPAGVRSLQLAEAFGVHQSTIIDCLIAHGIDRRSPGSVYGTVQHALDNVYSFGSVCETAFYICELARFPSSHSKPGISFDPDVRALGASGEYGSFELVQWFASRQEAFFLEQALLHMTRDFAACPEELIGWPGSSEVRALPATVLSGHAIWLLAQLEELGVWRFAAQFVPMTDGELAQCEQRAEMNSVST